MYVIKKKKIIFTYKNNNPLATQRELAEIFDLAVGTINSIVKNGPDIQTKHASTRYNMKKANFTTNVFDVKLFELFMFKRKRFCTIQDSCLQEMAKNLAEIYKISNFKASNGWLQKFKTRYNIKSKTIQGESGLVDERILDGFKNI
ncbi:Major centromere autoantigen B, partial [Dictyocoela muelleri]